jgi:hypothetical protein
MVELLITAALYGIFRTRPGAASDYDVSKTSVPFPGIVLFTIEPFTERYGVARNLETAVTYAETLLFDSLQNEPERFNEEWLLRFILVDLDSIEYPETPLEKTVVVKKYGFDVKAAMKDHRGCHRTVEHWLESVFDAHSFSLSHVDDCVYWRR